jgi:hypothetical protein
MIFRFMGRASSVTISGLLYVKMPDPGYKHLDSSQEMVNFFLVWDFFAAWETPNWILKRRAPTIHHSRPLEAAVDFAR